MNDLFTSKYMKNKMDNFWFYFSRYDRFIFITVDIFIFHYQYLHHDIGTRSGRPRHPSQVRRSHGCQSHHHCWVTSVTKRLHFQSIQFLVVAIHCFIHTFSSQGNNSYANIPIIGRTKWIKLRHLLSNEIGLKRMMIDNFNTFQNESKYCVYKVCILDLVQLQDDLEVILYF